MENNTEISLADQNADIREFEKNYEEAVTQVKADMEKRLKEMKEDHDKYLKELIEKRDNTAAQQKKDEADIDIKNADGLLRSVFTSMLNKTDEKDPAKTVKFITEQFMHFANDIFLPLVLPGYKIDCEFLKTHRTTIDGKKLPDDKDVRIKVILLSQDEYDERIEKLSKLSGCCGKCLASKHDLSKIAEFADEPYDRIIRANADLDDAFSEYEIANDIPANPKTRRLGATKLNLNTLRQKYNNIVEAILKVYPTCQLLTIPDDATFGQIIAAVMAGANVIKNLVSIIKEKKASKKSDKSELQVTGDRFPLPLQLGAKSKFTFPSAKSIVSKLVMYINQFYAADIPHVDPNACLVDVINALNKVIDFVNGKFVTEDKLRGVAVSKDTKMSVIHGILLTLIKILYSYFKETK